MTKSSKFKENEASAEIENDVTEAPEKTQSEAGKKISEAQRGVSKSRVQVTANGVAYSTLCAALVAHNLDKVKDWPAARNALKKDGTYTRMAPSEAVTEENPTPAEIEVVFALTNQDDAANDAAPAEEAA